MQELNMGDWLPRWWKSWKSKREFEAADASGLEPRDLRLLLQCWRLLVPSVLDPSWPSCWNLEPALLLPQQQPQEVQVTAAEGRVFPPADFQLPSGWVIGIPYILTEKQLYGVRECSNFILLHVAVQFSQHHLLKRLSFLHCIFWPPLSK